MRNGRAIVYWDSCIFLAWLNGEDRPDNEMDGVMSCLDDVRSGKTIIVFSAVGRVEVRKSRLPEDARNKLDRLMQSRGFQEVAFSAQVADLTAAIIEYYDKRKAKNGGRTLAFPDAQHLATAIHVEVDAFYTFDDGQKDKTTLGLLGLNGNVAGHQLIVCKPPIIQYRLRLD